MLSARSARKRALAPQERWGKRPHRLYKCGCDSPDLIVTPRRALGEKRGLGTVYYFPERKMNSRTVYRVEERDWDAKPSDSEEEEEKGKEKDDRTLRRYGDGTDPDTDSESDSDSDSDSEEEEEEKYETDDLEVLMELTQGCRNCIEREEERVIAHELFYQELIERDNERLRFLRNKLESLNREITAEVKKRRDHKKE